MSTYTRREMKAATFMIGLIQMLWAISALFPEESITMAYLLSVGLSTQWFAMQFMVGAAMLFGSVCKWRKLRHVALFLSSLVSFSMFLVLIKGGITAPVTISLPVFAVMSVVLLFCDARGKPREKNY